MPALAASFASLFLVGGHTVRYQFVDTGIVGHTNPLKPQSLRSRSVNRNLLACTRYTSYFVERGHIGCNTGLVSGFDREI
jgi:hypothetical protein